MSAGTAADLAALLGRSERVVAFTGAGISTESGIPDFRSPGGIWTRYDPREFTFDRYVESPDVRASSWAMRREFFHRSPDPNQAHRALVDLERVGRLRAVITQNIDGLHQLAGSADVVEIHGTARDVLCIGHMPTGGVPAGCGFRAALDWALARVDEGDADPACPDCGGLVKSATVSFGQVLFPGVVDEAVALVRAADLVLTVGSSLQVYPAADLPLEGIRSGAAVAIVNNEETPLDRLAEVVVHGQAGEVLPAAIQGALAE
jgi:NAD-dependent deacetylase